MSYSRCIKCDAMVSGYQKYCPDCVKRYGVEQDETFHKRTGYLDEAGYKAEFEKDLARARYDRGPIKQHKMIPARKEQLSPVYIPNTGKITKQSNPAYRKHAGSRPNN